LLPFWSVSIFGIGIIIASIDRGTRKEIVEIGLMKIIRYSLPLFLFIFITGCSGAVKLNYKPGQVPDTSKATKPLTILLKPYIDSRGDVAPNYVGKIESTVIDIQGDKLIIEKDVATSVNEAIKTHLTTAGFTVREEGEADIIMSGEIKKFRLDIKGRDEIEIEKVYIGDIYFGLSPLSVDIESGVYDVTIRLEGFKEKKEKVSIRKGQKTELEMNMEKE